MVSELKESLVSGMGSSYVVKDGKRRYHGVDEINTGKHPDFVARGEEGHESTADHAADVLAFCRIIRGVWTTNPGTIQARINAQRCDCLPIPYPVTPVKMMLTIPEGMFNSVACWAV